MSAATYDITIEQGTDWGITLSDFTEEGVAMDLTGYTARMQVRRSVTASATLAEFTTAGGSITIDAAEGTIAITMGHADTAALPACEAVYDLELIKPDGTVTRYLKGTVTIDAEVTR